jgi:methylated-DNA-[protein]-cysteine S-methyltransferase
MISTLQTIPVRSKLPYIIKKRQVIYEYRFLTEKFQLSIAQCPIMDMKLRHSILLTGFGRLIVLWAFRHDKPFIKNILLSKPEQSADVRLRAFFSHSTIGSCEEIDALSSDILRFLDGEQVEFSLENIDMESCSGFQRSVLLAESEIPRGAVSTYRRIGQYIGMPNAARAVGNALANNPFPIVIPCHRAIRSDNTLGGFQGGMRMKQFLLEMEGHCFGDNGRIVAPKFHY